MTESSDKGKGLPFGALVMEYDAACNALLEADRAEYAARREAIDARNRVNDLQKQIAARCTEMEKSAPSGTDWHSQRRERLPV